ncbi:MAG: hypothetical protein SPK02_09910, partial [Succinivibrio sp.]|nr:hypothetical protein [Succinivibrio sp.]
FFLINICSHDSSSKVKSFFLGMKNKLELSDKLTLKIDVNTARINIIIFFIRNLIRKIHSREKIEIDIQNSVLERQYRPSSTLLPSQAKNINVKDKRYKIGCHGFFVILYKKRRNFIITKIPN